MNRNFFQITESSVTPKTSSETMLRQDRLFLCRRPQVYLLSLLAVSLLPTRIWQHNPTGTLRGRPFIFRKDLSTIVNTRSQFKGHFMMIDLGVVSDFIDMQVKLDRSLRTLSISQVDMGRYFWLDSECKTQNPPRHSRNLNLWKYQTTSTSQSSMFITSRPSVV